jgi:hypothetical protein
MSRNCQIHCKPTLVRGFSGIIIDSTQDPLKRKKSIWKDEERVKEIHVSFRGEDSQVSGYEFV